MPLENALFLESDVAAARAVYGVGGHKPFGIVGVASVIVVCRAGLAAVGVAEHSPAVEFAREAPAALFGSARRPVYLDAVGAIAAAGYIHYSVACCLFIVSARVRIAVLPYGVNVCGNDCGGSLSVRGSFGSLLSLCGLSLYRRQDNCGLNGLLCGLGGLLGVLLGLLFLGLLHRRSL